MRLDRQQTEHAFRERLEGPFLVAFRPDAEDESPSVPHS
jgi:hypothetical protein